MVDSRRRWEQFFATKRSVASRFVVAALTASMGFGVTYYTHASTGFYFTSMLIVTVIFIALYCGAPLAISFAVIVSLAADYFFIPPVGALLGSRAGWEHLAIILTITTCTALGASWFRVVLREAIVAKREAEEARRVADDASMMMERVLALVSHDIRNPLATVKMAAQLLFAASPSTEQERELRAVVLRNLLQADGMIQSLLDVERVRAGKTIPIELESCDLVAEVRRMIADQSLPTLRRIELRADDDAIWGNWALGGIRRALQNLITNAVKYGAPNTPIVIALRRAGSRANLSVHNDGEPIAPTDQAHIFDAFERTHRSDASATQGWGLGLTIVKAIADAHGGHAVVESTANAGTTFTLDLPISLVLP